MKTKLIDKHYEVHVKLNNKCLSSVPVHYNTFLGKFLLESNATRRLKQELKLYYISGGIVVKFVTTCETVLKLNNNES
jgi:hypothetical protein